MTDADDTPPRGNDRPGRTRRDLMSKVVLPVAVAVLGAIAVAALTPLGDGLRELLFPTSAAVTGSVLIDGKPAGGAQVTLDKKRTFVTGDDGVYLIDDVGDGTHVLDVRRLGARPARRDFTVDQDESEKKVPAIELLPLATLAYAIQLGQPRFINRPGQTPTAEVDYDLRLWIGGQADDARRIASVTYTLPAQLASGPVAGAAAFPFCYRQRGVVIATAGGTVSNVEAVVELRDGRSFEISADQPSAALPPPCRASGTTPSAQPPAGSASPPPSGPPPSGPSPSPTPTPSPSTPPSGPTVVVVPAVVGLPVEAARARLRSAGLSARVVSVPSSEPVGTVVTQEPTAGADAAANATVRLDVSSGSAEESVAVPDVRGLTEPEATARLEAAGFVVRVVAQSTGDPEQDGIVLDQEPLPTGEKDRGTEVTITVGAFG